MSKFQKCFRRSLNSQQHRHMLLYRDGIERVTNALDVSKIVKNHTLVNLLKHILFRKQGR